MKHLLFFLLLPTLVWAQPPALGTKSTVCLPASQATIIFRSLRNYEKIKPALVKAKEANQAWRIAHEQDSLAYAGQERLINWYKLNYAEEQQLRQDADKKVVMWRSKARKRGLIIGIGVGVPAVYGGYRAGKALKLWK